MAVGDFFREVVYGPGNTLPWDEHVEKVTGEPLTAKYFVEQFVEEKD
jgi:Zn-dependent M32 family carboxypeptidase